MHQIMLIVAVFLFVGFVPVLPQVISGLTWNQGCKWFQDTIKEASELYDLEYQRNSLLQDDGFIASKADLGYGLSREEICNNSVYWSSGLGKTANILLTTAKLILDRNPESLPAFESYSKCYLRDQKLPTSRPKYRLISGYGNNLNNPRWGMANMPFRRLLPRNFDDNVDAPRKSITGNELPSPRRLVLDVLLKADKIKRTADDPNDLLNFVVLYLVSDLANQVPYESFDSCEEIRCCRSGNTGVLPPTLQNTKCMPIKVPDDDPFYGKAGVKCLNLLRSERVSSPATVQHGEILNRVTAFLDLSTIYGSNYAESKKVRSFVDGKLHMGDKNLLPTDKNGEYTANSKRFTSILFGAFFPVMFARNHNGLCDGLKGVNPHWSDEKLFQEARRINIAFLQKFFITLGLVEQIAKEKIHEPYNAKANPAIAIEFTQNAYRFLHYYVNQNMKLIDENGKVENIPVSDTFGKIELLEKRFDEVLRGAMGQKVNYNQYSEEAVFKFGKNEKGVGLDLISTDIQRGRDHGQPTFLQLRRHCGLPADYKTFDDMITLYPQQYIDLLKNTYESVEDIDVYVGGVLESFRIVETAFFGDTFGCVITNNFKNMMAADSYWYSHPENPYQFTPQQLTIIENYDIPNLICVNTGFKTIQQAWYNVPNNKENTFVSCDQFKQIDFSAWKEDSRK